MRYIITLNLFLIVSCAFSQEETFSAPTKESFNLKGDIQKVTEITYIAHKTDTALEKKKKGNIYEWEQNQLFEFNRNGLLISKSYLNKRLNQKSKDQYVYENNLLKKKITKFITETYSYDSINRIEQIIRLDKSPQTFVTGKEKPVNGIQTTLTFEYQENKIISIKEYDSKNKLLSNETRQYTGQGQIQHQECTIPDYKDWYNYTYDENGLLSQIKWSDNEEGLLEKTTYEYDKNKRVSHEKWELYIEGDFNGFVDYTYENGLEITIFEKDSEGNLDLYETYSYTFDSKGNWITMSISIDNEKYYIREREIVYH